MAVAYHVRTISVADHSGPHVIRQFIYGKLYFGLRVGLYPLRCNMFV